jgi:hypothetical protein
MLNKIGIILGVLSLLLIPYLLISFAVWNLNPAEWKEGVRVLTVMADIGILIFKPLLFDWMR